MNQKSTIDENLSDEEGDLIEEIGILKD